MFYSNCPLCGSDFMTSYNFPYEKMGVAYCPAYIEELSLTHYAVDYYKESINSFGCIETFIIGNYSIKNTLHLDGSVRALIINRTVYTNYNAIFNTRISPEKYKNYIVFG